ncbi:MAG: hypothetical protein DRO18_02150 [Thermoprotei archaeon]|nr:MAG: hypothetical protein DRO18_02150 [Thermoprotei archaeon]
MSKIRYGLQMSEQEDREISEILDRIARSLIKEKEKKLLHEVVNEESPHGLYIFDVSKSMWRYIENPGDEAWVPKEDGYYIIYFDNTACPACRRYDPTWFSFTKKYAPKLKDHKFVIILCEWFARRCKSPVASKTFKYFEVHASPTTMLVGVVNGKIVHKEKYEGVLKYDELSKVVLGFKERVEKVLRGEPVEKPLKSEEIPEEVAKILVALLSGDIEKVKQYLYKKEGRKG